VVEAAYLLRYVLRNHALTIQQIADVECHFKLLVACLTFYMQGPVAFLPQIESAFLESQTKGNAINNLRLPPVMIKSACLYF